MTGVRDAPFPQWWTPVVVYHGLLVLVLLCHKSIDERERGVA